MIFSSESEMYILYKRFYDIMLTALLQDLLDRFARSFTEHPCNIANI